ncbi:MAG: zf-HC2 domain-containing protein [Gammaproteobacteria bacterium]
MLTCREVTRHASDYLDRELPWRRRLAVRLHLLMCTKCRRLVHHLRQLVTAMSARAASTAPPLDADAIDRLLARVPLASAPRAGGDEEPGASR